MGVGWKFPGRAVGLAALGILMLAAAAGADPSADFSLMFDPAAMDHSYLRLDRNPQRSPPRPDESDWSSIVVKLPSFKDSFAVGGLADGFSVAPNRSQSAGANVLEPRLTFGTLSIGLETDTSIKPRSSAGDAEKDPERDTILDQKRQRGFLPFIGLSAKSSLQ